MVAGCGAARKPAYSSMRTCSENGCGEPHDARGYCSRHYAAWRRGNDPDYVAAQRAWKKSDAGKASASRYHRERYRDDPEFRRGKRLQATARRGKPGFRAKRRERYRNDAEHREKVKRRVARRKAAGGRGLRRRADMEARYAAQEGRCGICGGPLPEDAMSPETHVDHIVPVADGGTGHELNLQLVHRRCNQEKWAHGPEQPHLFARAERETQ